MKKYDVILFDLDGTLTDPGEGITNSVAHALEKVGIAVESRESLFPYIGPPLRDSFMNFAGMDYDGATQAIEDYREYYRVKGLFENILYPGMKECLARLQQAGKRLLVATSKPELFARQILEHFGIDGYFEYVAGADMAEIRVKKADIIAYGLEECGISDVSRVLMVGDRYFDVEGAKAFGMDCMGVTYGYGSREELLEAGAAYLADSAEDVARQILGE